MRRVTPTARKPNEYFFRQCLVSADPDETVIAQIIEAVGADFFVWAEPPLALRPTNCGS
jgi:hypothetical protein